ncbi:TPA: type II/IV secretion system ATPase subunit [Candidatus Woesearchaeota archaeon]|nr:type II/IV secretion system ATPase subunit [Candidatus Woesearchaeota archaeon]HII68843.1 type II/IV secretion system ATPase subunit [Candidatus Woesearchaeota archaeon]
MALFDAKKQPFSYEVLREGEEVTLLIDCEEYFKLPSIEDDPITMEKTCDILASVSHATKIIFAQKRNYEYDFSQVAMLVEVAKLYNMLIRRKDILGYDAVVTDPDFQRCIPNWFSEIRHAVNNLMRSDPLGSYVELRRMLRREKIREESTIDDGCIRSEQKVISWLTHILAMFEKTRIIQEAKPYLSGFRMGDREVYRRIFKPTIKPDFMFTKLMATYPAEGDELDNYTVADDTDVTIFQLPDTVQYLYHLVPPEFKLSEDEYEVLDAARKIMAEHKPKKEEFVDPARMRQVFHNVGYDLIEELISHKNYKIKPKSIEKLTKILVRYTVGFGLIEVILQDEKIQDISINSPMGNIPIYIVHQDYGDCVTNMIPTKSEAESWASKLRMMSGRPLDEANPILDTELALPGAMSRVAVISPPLNPTGLAYSLRRHRDRPWTLPLFIKHRMLNSLAAGILSFLIDGARTMLVAGTRSAGKSSLLGAVMTEIMRRYRVITIEDTLELPVSSLRNLGYNIQSMKVASSLTKGTSEVAAEEGIRTTLRLGDSSLIIGEVRSVEARALYEAMRIGALANVVAGTIHGDSPYGVFDRVVNDLGVPRTSFKATDIIVVANPVRSADGLHRFRRITQISEVRKHWEQDPLLESGFVDLMKYDSKEDELIPSPDLMNGDSEIIKAIAGNVKEWAGNWDAVWDNILLRARIKETLVEMSVKEKAPELLEAEFVIRANDEFHKASDKVKEEVGALDSKRIFFEWNEWLQREVKKKAIEA